MTVSVSAPGSASASAPAPAPAPLCPDPRIGVEWYTARPARADDGRAIVFLDIDNTLYSSATDPSIAALMKDKIRAYFESIGLARAEAERLHQTYYRSYGLAIRGLVKHHDIDPLDYDDKCDAALPLQDILTPNPALVALIANLDRSKCRVFALTNAYRVHARRVLDLTHLTPFIEGCIYCDYTMPDFACKPEPEFYLAVRPRPPLPSTFFLFSFIVYPFGHCPRGLVEPAFQGQRTDPPGHPDGLSAERRALTAHRCRPWTRWAHAPLTGATLWTTHSETSGQPRRLDGARASSSPRPCPRKVAAAARRPAQAQARAHSCTA